jgi:arylsulfatase
VLGQTQAEAPSIVLISLDTFRADRLGAYGHSGDLTPNLDRFAEEAVLFEHTIAQSNETLFSHASLFTSRYASELGSVDYSFQFPETVPTLAEILSIYGYQTAAMVAGGHLAPVFELGRGFASYQMPREWGSLYHTRRAAQRWLEDRAVSEPYFLFIHAYDTHKRYLKPAPYGLMEASPSYDGPGRDAVHQIHGTAEMVDGVWYPGLTQPQIFEINALRQRRSSGHVLRASPSEGTPLWPDDLEFVVDIYDGAVRYVDAQFGLLMADLQSQGVLDEAIVVVISDHGEELGEHGIFDHRTWLTRETQLVPMMIRLPDGRDGGRRVSDPAALLDVLPTLIEAAGLEAPADIRGVSWWGLLSRGETSPVDSDRVLFSEGVWRVVSATDGRDGLVFSGISAHSPLLSQGIKSAALPGPAFDAWQGTESEAQARLAQAMMDWRDGLPESPGGVQPLSEERRRILQQQGYWGMD